MSERKHFIRFNPSYATIRNFYFAPSVGTLQNADFGAFVEHKKVDTGLAGRAFHHHRRLHQDGLILHVRSLFQLGGKEHRQGKSQQENDARKEAQAEGGFPPCGLRYR